MLISILEIIIIIIPILGSIAYLTLAERKVMGYMQRRIGPNRVGIYGILQPIADGIKLILKETINPSVSNKIIFLFAPFISFVLAILAWAVIPLSIGTVLSDMNLGLMYLLAISSLGTYGIIFAGWSSNSKYSLFGSLRTTAQLISYEVAIGLILLPIVVMVGSFNFIKIVENQKAIYFFFPLFPLTLLFFISIIAETNRAPFDLSEAESELVSGFLTEYSSFSFALFFLAEYCNMILMSTFLSIFFLGGYLTPNIFDICNISTLQPIILGIKTSFILFSMIWIRASFPRLRFDQLITLFWTSMLPLSLAFIVLVPSILITFNNTNILL
jgi:NADH:ubiquinone oxidoreductase subunit H